MFWRKPPPPLPFYRQKPVATAAVILTMVAMFVLAPVGTIYKGMTEELKAKADNKTVILLIQQIKENDARQWKEIENNRKQQQVMVAPKALKLKANISQIQIKKPVPPDYFQAYMALPEQSKVGYKKYLDHLGFDVRGLP